MQVTSIIINYRTNFVDDFRQRFNVLLKLFQFRPVCILINRFILMTQHLIISKLLLRLLVCCTLLVKLLTNICLNGAWYWVESCFFLWKKCEVNDGHLLKFWTILFLPENSQQTFNENYFNMTFIKEYIKTKCCRKLK